VASRCAASVVEGTKLCDVNVEVFQSVKPFSEVLTAFSCRIKNVQVVRNKNGELTIA